MASIVIAYYDASGNISSVHVEKPVDLNAFVEHFETHEGVIDTVYEDTTCLYRSAANFADFN